MDESITPSSIIDQSTILPSINCRKCRSNEGDSTIHRRFSHYRAARRKLHREGDATAYATRLAIKLPISGYESKSRRVGQRSPWRRSAAEKRDLLRIKHNVKEEDASRVIKLPESSFSFTDSTAQRSSFVTDGGDSVADDLSSLSLESSPVNVFLQETAVAGEK